MRVLVFPESSYAANPALITLIKPHSMSSAPVNKLICTPHGVVFSSSTNSAIAATQARFISPPTNSNAINSQQQPRQKIPCRIPVNPAPSAP